MSEELVARLRGKTWYWHSQTGACYILDGSPSEAADTIERLTKERDEAVKETTRLRNTMQLHAGDVQSAQLEADREHARAEEAEARVDVLDEALRKVRVTSERGDVPVYHLLHACSDIARAALTASHSPAQPPAPPPEK